MKKILFCILGFSLLSLFGCANKNSSTNPAVNSDNYRPTTVDSFNKKIETSKGYYQIDYLSIEDDKIIIGGLFYYIENVDSFSLFYEITNNDDAEMIFDECALLSSSSIIELNKEIYCYYSFSLTDEIINHNIQHQNASNLQLLIFYDL